MYYNIMYYVSEVYVRGDVREDRCDEVRCEGCV